MGSHGAESTLSGGRFCEKSYSVVVKTFVVLLYSGDPPASKMGHRLRWEDGPSHRSMAPNLEINDFHNFQCNFFFLTNIMRVLVSKLRSSHGQEPIQFR